MSTIRTMTEMAKAVMLDMGLLDATEDPVAQDREYIIGIYEDLMAEMRDERLIYWPDNAIPKEDFQAVVKFMSLNVGSGFGIPMATGRAFEQELDYAKRRLRRRVVKESSGLDTHSADF